METRLFKIVAWSLVKSVGMRREDLEQADDRFIGGPRIGDDGSGHEGA